MLELLASPDAADLPILDRAREILAGQPGGAICEATILEVNARQGTDLATALLYVYFESKLQCTRDSSGGSQFDLDERPLLVAIAPGAFYREHPEIGSDGREIVGLSTSHAWSCEVIPSQSIGTLHANACIIGDYLENATRTHRVILVSLSKGTTDALTAQRQRPDLFHSLQGWVSVSGILHGTAMADWLLDRWHLRPILQLMLWRHSVDDQAVRDMRYSRVEANESQKRAAPGRMLHIAGFPLKRHLSCRRARLWHRRLRREGPNDGILFLADLLRVPGIVLPVWGADHYMQSDWNVSAAVVRLIADFEAAAQRHSSISRDGDDPGSHGIRRRSLSTPT